MAPPDKILGLNEGFAKDNDMNKVNLGVGAYRDTNGKPFVLPVVREAEKRVLSKEMDHEYAGIAGIQEYINLSCQFAYGKNSRIMNENRLAAIQSLSGTGSCRIIGEFLSKFVGENTNIYLPQPTWGNHLNIFKNAKLTPTYYTYFDPESCSVDFDNLINDVESAPNGSIFVFHACAHNPTGCDPTPEQWDELSSLSLKKEHVIFFDCAYQGFASGNAEKDAYSIRKFVKDGHNIILSQSFAKNFGLYGERIGTISVVCEDIEEKDRVLSQLKSLARAMYSNPPVYGARLVCEILKDEVLAEQWTKECKAMADRIIAMRQSLRRKIEQLGSTKSWSHITDQIGMFAFTGLTKDQVLKMRKEFHVYCTEDGRISVAGLNPGNLNHVAKAIHSVSS